MVEAELVGGFARGGGSPLVTGPPKMVARVLGIIELVTFGLPRLAVDGFR